MMASTATKHTATCLVCYETRPLKIVGNCKHSFCTECLSSVLESLDSGTEVFACPTCKVDCPRPWDGLKGVVDFTGEAVSSQAVAKEVVVQGRGKDILKPEPKPKKKPQIVETKCQLCRHKKKDVLAVSMCVECGHFYFCQDCTDTHARKKATKNHSVIMLTAVKEDIAVCEAHETDLSSFCQTCSKAVCTICVMEDHGDHVIQELGETIDTKADQLKTALEKQEKKLTGLQDQEKELILLKRLTPTVDKQDVLIKEIEDHAVRLIKQIVKWKEDLKAQVKADFKVIDDVPKGLEKVSEAVQKLKEVITRGSKLLRETTHQPVYIDKLVALQQELGDIDGIGDNVEGKEFKNGFRELHESNRSFVPKDIPTTLGEVLGQERPSREFKPKEIFTKTLQVNSKDMFIPCVANLGKKFAVAHPTKEGEYSNAIEIYGLPGTLIKTLRDHVPPIYDMSSTPDGKLAVLSNGTVDSGCSVQLFDPETGYIRSTCDITEVTKPLSLGVTLLNQYVILGDNDQGQREITVVDKNGAVLHKHMMEAEVKFKDPKRITCGGRFIFAKGDRCVAVGEIKDTGLQIVQTGFMLSTSSTYHFSDIAATVWDDFIVSNTSSTNLYLDMYQDKENTLKWSYQGHLKVCENKTEIKKESQVSERDGHIVMSHGQTIRVYKL